MNVRSFNAYHFFAGGGFVEYGMPRGMFNVLYANDFDEMKAATYAMNWGGEHLVCGDVAKICLLYTSPSPRD